MCAYDALIAAPETTLLDYSVLQSTRTGGSRMSGMLSDAIIAYGKLLLLMRLSPEERHFHSLIVNNSWGMFSWSWDFPAGHPGRYGDNPNHPFDLGRGRYRRFRNRPGDCLAQCWCDRTH
jgi:hypothetical protein